MIPGSGDCIGDSGYSEGEARRAAAVQLAAVISQTAAVAIAIDNAKRLIENMRMQRDIQRRVTNISEKQQNQIATVFWPREEAFLNEFANPDPIEEVEVMGRRYGGRLVAAVAGKFATAIAEARCNFRRYCTSANKKVLQDLMMARASAIANARVLGRNIAFAEFQARTDVNYNRRFQAVALGRSLQGEALSLLKAAGDGLARAGEEVSKSLSGALYDFGNARGKYLAAGERLDDLASGNFVNPYPNYAQSSAYMQSSYAASTQPFAWATGVNTNFSSYQGSGYFDLQTSQTMSDPTPSFGTNPFISPNRSLQFEQWNNGDVGNRDLVRDGTYTYPVQGNMYGGFVTVKMSDFMMKYADHKTEGDYRL